MKSPAINKHHRIKHLTEYLQNKYNGEILIKDFWKTDLCAIRLSDITEQYLIYISVFRLPPDKFNIVLENIQRDIENIVTVGEFNNITLEKLETILIGHFQIK